MATASWPDLFESDDFDPAQEPNETFDLLGSLNDALLDPIPSLNPPLNFFPSLPSPGHATQFTSSLSPELQHAFDFWSSQPDPFQIASPARLSHTEGFEIASYNTNAGPRGLAECQEATAVVLPAKVNTRQKKIKGGYPCIECGKPFDTAGSLNKHLKRAHVPDSLRSYVCPHCSKRFPQQRDLDRHSAQHQAAGSAPDFRIADEAPLTKRRRLYSPVRLSPGERPSAVRLRKRGLSPSGADSPVAQKRPAGSVKEIFTSSFSVASDPLTVICIAGNRWREPRSHGLDRNGLHQIEQILHQTSGKTLSADELTPRPSGDMMAISGHIVLVAPQGLVFSLSSAFNPESTFKLRSLKVPKQRAKLERDLYALSDTERTWIKRKVVFVGSKHERPVIKDADSWETLMRLFSMLAVSANVVGDTKRDLIQGSSPRARPTALTVTMRYLIPQPFAYAPAEMEMLRIRAMHGFELLENNSSILYWQNPTQLRLCGWRAGVFFTSALEKHDLKSIYEALPRGSESLVLLILPE